MPVGINPDIADLLTKGLLSDIKHKVLKDMEENLVSEFRANIQQILKEYVERITILRVEEVRNALRMREEFYVEVEVVNKEAKTLQRR